EFKQPCVRDQSNFYHLCQPCAQMTPWNAMQESWMHKDVFRRVKDTQCTLLFLEVHCSFNTYSRVDLANQSRGHSDVRKSATDPSCSYRNQITAHATADGDQDRSAVQFTPIVLLADFLHCLKLF